MSTFCDALVALNLTMGVLCQPADDAKAPALPDDDKRVWEISPPAPPPEIQTPVFPPVVIKQEMPAPPAPPPPPPAVAPPPPPPNLYRLALEAALGDRGDPSAGIATIEGQQGLGDPKNGVQLASLTPPALDPLGLSQPKAAPKYEAEGVISGLPVDNERILAADRYISGILETGINSQLDSGAGGSAIVQVSRDVFGYHGRMVLIPKGSRLICDYKGPGRQGETRIGFTCSRILMGGHRAEILQLASPLGDVQGHGGVSGEVDNRFWEKYGTAFLLAGISASVRLATAASTTDNTNSTAVVADKGAEELSQKIGEITASILEQTVNLAPIITIPQGTRVQIRPAKDWYIQEIGANQP